MRPRIRSPSARRCDIANAGSGAVNELLSVAEMYAADRAAMDGGVSGLTLMEAAGKGVADAVSDRFGPQPVAVLCGPGNNGGDGFVIARHLRAAGATVRLALLGDKSRLKGDAAAMAKRWRGKVMPMSPDVLDGAALVVDAIFGAGLTRDVDGAARDVLAAAAARGLPSIAVDVPSGVHGDTGAIRGCALPAAMTVTFFRRKPGHLLLPGRRQCGEVRVVDIGIPAAVLDGISPQTWENTAELWAERFPWPRLDGHKYGRGHAVVASGPRGKSGAARLAARAALRAGAGLVTVLAPASAMAENAAQLTAVMLAETRGEDGFADAIADRRRNAILVGPGNGVTAATRRHVLAALKTRRACVLDADALTVFARAPQTLFKAVRGPCLMTPHEGEFGRLFDPAGDKLTRARAAARASGAVILLKGPDTVVAAPDGRAAINTNAPPTLATAGSGDVLGGIALGLMAQGMTPFDAGCAAAWLHGTAARQFGAGLIAEDLCEALPSALAELPRP